MRFLRWSLLLIVSISENVLSQNPLTVVSSLSPGGGDVTQPPTTLTTPDPPPVTTPTTSPQPSPPTTTNPTTNDRPTTPIPSTPDQTTQPVQTGTVTQTQVREGTTTAVPTPGRTSSVVVVVTTEGQTITQVGATPFVRKRALTPLRPEPTQLLHLQLPSLQLYKATETMEEMVEVEVVAKVGPSV